MNEAFQLNEGFVVWRLAWRMLAISRCGRVDDSRNAPIEREASTSYEIDGDARAVGRILDRQTKLEVHWDAAKQLTFHSQKADFVVVLPRYVIAWADVNLVRVEPMLGDGLNGLGLADLFGC